MSIKLIATDMDDTLLDNHQKISQRNEAAIKQAAAQGIKVVFATGRMFISAQTYAKELGMDVPLVAYNGGLVKGSVSEKVYYEKKVELSTAHDVLQYCHEKKFYIQYYKDENLYIEAPNDFSARYMSIAHITPIAIGEELYHPTAAPNKLLVMTSSEEFDKAWQDIAQRFAGRLDVTSSKTNFLELMEPGVNKWSAVKAVGEMYKIKPEEIMCIGDSNNDLPMIANAGIGVAVANAPEPVQKAAKIVTASNDNDGVAMVIEQILTKQINVPN